MNTLELTLTINNNIPEFRGDKVKFYELLWFYVDFCCNI